MDMRSSLPIKLISAIVLISALSLVSGIPLLQASAATVRHSNAILASESTYPKALSWRVRQDLAQRMGIPENELQVTVAERKTWSDGCLELAQLNELCTQQLVEGWRVVVANGQQTWVYHTDLQGRSLRFADSQPQTMLPRNVVFRSQSTGGFAGQTYETVLFSDGRMQQKINVNRQKVAPVRSWRISASQVQQFLDVLNREQFQRFDHKTYSPTSGAADFFVVTLTSPNGTVQYADIEQGKLPRSLKTIIQAWNALQ